MSDLVQASKKMRQRRRWNVAFLCTLLLALESCGIPKYRLALPGRILPDTFKGETEVTTESSAQVGIDEFFNDQLLSGLIYQGLGGNQELKILGEEIQIANNEFLRRRGAYLPFVSLGTRAGLDKPSFYTPFGAAEEQLLAPNGGGFPTPLPDFMVAANVSWQVDIWRQLRNSRDAASLRLLATTDGRNYIVTRLVAEIAANYYKLMALDKRLENLDTIIVLQERSLEIAKANKEGARGTELPVQRFQAEVRKNQSEKLIVKQQIVEVENRINFLAGRYPQPVQRVSAEFFDLELGNLKLGLPSQLLLNRPDIRQAERELEASGLDVKVARANFYPKLNLYAGVGFEAFNPRYIVMTPESLIYNVTGDLMAPLINKSGIKADYKNANARQLQSMYEYQRTILEAFTDVFNQISAVQNYSESLRVKRQQLVALEASVDAATRLFQNARVEYIDILFAQRDLLDARMVFIETKTEQLSAIVNTYQSLGGGLVPPEILDWSLVPPQPLIDTPAIPHGTLRGCPPVRPEDMWPAPIPPDGLLPMPAGAQPTPAPGADGSMLVPPSPANGNTGAGIILSPMPPTITPPTDSPAPTLAPPAPAPEATPDAAATPPAPLLPAN